MMMRGEKEVDITMITLKTDKVLNQKSNGPLKIEKKKFLPDNLQREF